MTTPALRALKERFRQAEVTYVCERTFSAALRSNAHVDTLLPLDAAGGLRAGLRLLATLRARRFDLALDFESSPFTAALSLGSGAARRIGFGSGLHAYAYTDRVKPTGRPVYGAAEKIALLRPLGIEVRTSDLRPELNVELRARDWVAKTLEAAGIGTTTFLVTLAPAARAPELRWPVERYARLLDMLAATHDFEAVLILPDGEERLAADLASFTNVSLFQLSTPPSPTQVAALLDRADLHIGNENAARHTATALGTATVTVYVPGERGRWGMPGDPLQVGLEAPEPAPRVAGHAGPDRVQNASTGGGSAAITRVTAEAAFAAVVGLEAYLPRLRAARRATAPGRSGGRASTDPAFRGSGDLPLWTRHPIRSQPTTPAQGRPMRTGGAP